MYQLIYLSFATSEFDPEGDLGIDSILKVANQYNAEHEITGMLLYKGKVFLQILEGEQDEVEKLFEKICRDKRHADLVRIVDQNVSERIFPEWTMAYRKVDDIDLEQLNKVIPWQELVDLALDGKHISQEKILNLFKIFRFVLKPN